MIDRLADGLPHWPLSLPAMLALAACGGGGGGGGAAATASPGTVATAPAPAPVAPGGSTATGSTTSNTPSTRPCIGPLGIAFEPAGRYVYVTNGGCDTGNGASYPGFLSMYSVDAATGQLASLGPSLPTLGDGAKGIAVDPTGRFVYVANWGEGDVAMSLDSYRLDAASGLLSLTGTQGGSCPGLCAPWSVATDPGGRFAFVTSQGGYAPTGLNAFRIDTATGVLTGWSSRLTASRARAVAVAPQGRHAYVTVSTAGSPTPTPGMVETFAIDATSGALTSLGTVAAGLNPEGIAIAPGGRHLYATNAASNDVSMYAIDEASGRLTAIGRVAAGTNPLAVAVHPGGGFAYVVNGRVSYAPTPGSNDVSMYAIDPATGTLTPRGTVATGAGPTAIAVHPSGMFIYVTSSGTESVFIYRVDDVAGQLTAIGQVPT